MMKNDKKTTVLITGAGSGMGLHTARTLATAGYMVYAGVRDPNGRNTEKSQNLLKELNGAEKNIEIVDLDILQDNSCRNAADQIVAQHESIDVVIHNAAHLYIGFSEAFEPEQLASSLNTNLIGAHRLNRAVLPHMRKEGKGLILYVGSGITNVTAPFMAPYVVGKAALDALAENTAYEISQFGVETTILMPGVYMDDTLHFAAAEFPHDEKVLKDYTRLEKDYDNYEPGLRNLFRFGDAPIQSVADKIAEILALPAGQRPLRDTVDFSDWVAEPGNGVREALTERAFRIMGYSHLLRVKY
ncbi:SDR family NAD(P)-dependent oxidoreductase [Pedobacter sp. G11]|uniref:SDR family NAD(P)-dependent oxidoreductase n=1 Tax=Pedobacter sp. G11 TaxID=2482728 RepID=UPI001AEFC7DE|nr:SDR family NAD(P)-dependent oxidoreductase [Pedobacter sp. G11]